MPLPEADLGGSADDGAHGRALLAELLLRARQSGPLLNQVVPLEPGVLRQWRVLPLGTE